MEFKPGDIVHRKFSDKNDLYCVIVFEISHLLSESKHYRLLPYYRHGAGGLDTEIKDSCEQWFEKIDFSQYDIRDKFLRKIYDFLDANLNKPIGYESVLDNLRYIEILDGLRQYKKQDVDPINPT